MDIHKGGHVDKVGKWTAIIGTVAAVVSAIAALLVYVIPSDSSGDSSGGPSAGPVPSTAPTTSGTPTTEVPTTVSSEPPPVVWTGPLLVSGSGVSGPSFDATPPKTEDTLPDLTYYNDHLQDLNSNVVTGTALAAWRDKGEPTQKQCSDLVDTQSVVQIVARVGLTVCLKSIEDQRTVMVRVTRIDRGDEGAVHLDATVWANADE